MSNTILLKRSAVANSVPVTGNLALGELAINTYDGKLYTKIDNGTPSIFELTQNQTITLTGNITGSGTSTINATLSTTGVTANTYGGSGQIPTFTVDQYGRISAASNVAISTSSISNGTSNVNIGTSGGNVTIGVGGTPNILVVTSTGANVTGYITATGNVTAPYFIGDVIGNISGNLALSGFDTGVVFNDGGQANAVSAFTFNKSTNALTAAGNITGANLVSNAGVFGSTLSVTGNANVGNIGGTNAVFTNLTGTLQTAAQPNITSVGTLGSLSVTGNVSTGNVSGTLGAFTTVTGTTITASGNLVGGNANITSAVNAATVVASGNVTGGNLVTGGALSVSGNANVGNIGGTNAEFTTVTASGNLVGGNANITNAVNTATVVASGNITAGNIITSGPSGNISGANVVSATTFNASGNVLAGNVNSNAAVTGVTGVFSGNVSTGNVSGTTGTFTNVAGTLTTAAQPNITSVGTLSSLTVSGNIVGGNITSNAAINGVTITASGNLVGGNANITSAVNTATVNASGNVLAGNLNSNAAVTGVTFVASGNVSAGNVSATNLVSATTVTATGNVSGGNVNTNNLVGTGVTITSTGDLNLQPTGNIALGNRFINGVAYPVQNQDAASKLYVDNMVSTGLVYHQAVFAATTDTLANITGGTITYNQPNGAGNGIGATLTTSTSFNLIDTANVQTVGTRILVKDQANAVQNGVYVWSNATVITRSIDADEYGPDSAEQLSLNDYFFVQSGNVNKGSAWVVDAPTGTITFGTSNIDFAQFSSSQTYTANTSAGIVLDGTVFSTKVDNNTTAFDGGGNIRVKDGANLTTPNIGDATGNSLTLTGNGLVSATTVTATGNVSGGNVNATTAVNAATITATGNLVGGNANITNAVYSATVLATGNVTGGNLITGGAVSATGNVSGGNISTSGLLSVTGNANVGNIGATTVVATNVAGTLTTAAQPNITSVGTLTSLSVTGNVAAGNVSGTLLTGTLTTAAQPNVTSVGTLTSLNVSGNANVGNIGATNGVFSGALSGITTINASGTATVGNVNTAGLISATGNITGGNIISNALVSGTTFTATGNVTGGNANITSATISTSTTTGALIVAGGAGIAGNIYGGDIYKNNVIVLNANDTVDGGTY